MSQSFHTLNAIQRVLALVLCVTASGSVYAKTNESDSDNSEQHIEAVYQDVIVLQPVRHQRDSRFSSGARIEMDFSDGAESRYSITVHSSYGLSKILDVGAYVTPLFLTQNRAINDSIKDLDFAGDADAELVSDKPKMAYGIEMYWYLAYGKDAWTDKRLMRSDTFMRLAAGLTSFEGGQNVEDYGVYFGKTYYFREKLNLRLSCGVKNNSGSVDGVKQHFLAGILDLGLIWLF